MLAMKASAPPRLPVPVPVRRGLSLIELTIVLAVVAVLVCLALPGMADLVRRYQINTAAADLHGALNLARAQAIARARRVTLAPLEPAGLDWGGGWVVFIDTNADRRPGPGEEVLASHGPVPDGMVLHSSFTSNAAPYYMAFNSAGRGCSNTSSQAARWGTVSLSLGREVRRLRINMLGRVRVCDPARPQEGCPAQDQGPEG